MTKDLTACYYQLSHAIHDLREHLTIIKGQRWLTVRGDGDPNIGLALRVIESSMADLTMSVMWLINYTGNEFKRINEEIEHEKKDTGSGE